MKFFFQNRLLVIWLCLLGCFAPVTGALAEPFLFSPEKEISFLGKYAKVAEDKKGVWKIDDVKRNGMIWRQSDREVFNFGFSDSVYWIRFSLQNSSTLAADMILQVSNPLIDYLDIYYNCGKEKSRAVLVGDRRPFSQREIKNRLFQTPVFFQPGEICHVYIRSATHDGLHESLPIQLVTREKSESDSLFYYLIFGVLYGSLLVLLIYHLSVFIGLGDSSSLYYMLYSFCFIIWSLAFHGFGSQYLWPEWPHVGNRILGFSNLLFTAAFVLFINHYLQTKKKMPVHYKISAVIIAILMLFSPVILFYKYALFYKIFFPAGVAAVLYTFALVIMSIARGERESYFLLSAWVAVGLGGIVYVLKMYDILESSFFTENGFHIGAVLQFFLLAAGLMYRVQKLRRERETALEETAVAQRRTLDEREEMTRVLEKQVYERTADLSQANEELNLKNQHLIETKMIMEQDLELAARVQRTFFQWGRPAAQDWELAVSCMPAASVSGDFFDYYRDSSGHLKGITLCDVSGHGVSSGLISMVAKSIIFRELNLDSDALLSERIFRVNERLTDEIGMVENFLTGVFL